MVLSLEQRILLGCLAAMAMVLVIFVLWLLRVRILTAVLRPFAPILRPLVRPFAERFWAREEARLKEERKAFVRRFTRGRAPEPQAGCQGEEE